IPSLRIGTKVDLGAAPSHEYDLVISSTTGTGLSDLLDEISRRAASAIGDTGDVLPSRLRHVELLAEAQDFLSAAAMGLSQELRAEELRLASDRLGRIVGAVDVEDMLDVIFSQFCIGK
ncbi:MAG: tRNA uridine-5-carboxymethylaminomethyl(34) synthesis GTPase MnmE, partial [Mesorhizobium sp.]